MSNPTATCPTDRVLAAHFLEGDQTTGSPIQGHVAICPACREKLLEMEADRKAFLVHHPFSSFWEGLERRRPRRKGLWTRFLAGGLLRAAAAMASVGFLMIVVMHRPERTPEILSKGGVDIGFYVAASDGNEAKRGKSGMTLPQGSSLQFVYSAPARTTHLLLVGVEADGTLSVYFPASGSRSGDVNAGEMKKLPQALRWQPKSAYERFYGVFSKEPVSVETVRKAVETLKASGKTIEQGSRLPIPYPQESTIIYRESS